jgi:Mn-dependent DtxR family transcriptional regulator
MKNREKDVLKVIKSYQAKHSESPSVVQIAHQVDISRTAAHASIDILVALGKLVKQPKLKVVD